jgi:exodeoxyribonuclease V alpha subunit
VLVSADIHVARILAELSGCDEELVVLGAAFAVRAPRLGHTCVDLTTIHETADTDEDSLPLEDLPWPDAQLWIESMTRSTLVESGAPLRIEGTLLYLDRYWSDECQVAADLLSKAASGVDDLDLEVLIEGTERLLSGNTDPLQRLASVSAVLRRFTVIAGGPGTGKTTTVARILALLFEQGLSSHDRLPLVAVAAPTGKAANRLQEAIREEAPRSGEHHAL